MIKEGIYTPEQLSNEDYHADSAIGSSGLIKFSECPALYYAEYLDQNRPARPSSQVLRFGSAAHVTLLEPDKFDSMYAIADPSIDKKTTKPWKDFKVEAEANNKEPLLYKEYESLCQMAAMIKRNELANSMLTGGKAEMSFFAKDSDTGLMLKARPDYLVRIPEIGDVIVDYKTTTISLNTQKQSNHAFGLHRYIQASHHKKVVELATGGNIAYVCYVVQMQNYPYLVRVFAMGENEIQIGNDECQVLLEKIKTCQASGIWPDDWNDAQEYTSSIITYEPPAWWNYKYN